MLFVFGDYLFGVLAGAAIALVMHGIVWPGTDLVIATLAGMAVGMILFPLLTFLFAPLIGMFQPMASGSLIGVFGGMLFGMRDAMAAGSAALLPTALVGAGFGAAVVLGVKAYDAALRGTALDASE